MKLRCKANENGTNCFPSTMTPHHAHIYGQATHTWTSNTYADKQAKDESHGNEMAGWVQFLQRSQQGLEKAQPH